MFTSVENLSAKDTRSRRRIEDAIYLGYPPSRNRCFKTGIVAMALIPSLQYAVLFVDMTADRRVELFLPDTIMRMEG